MSSISLVLITWLYIKENDDSLPWKWLMYFRCECNFRNILTPLKAVGHTKDDFIMCEECLLLIVHCRKTASSSLGSGGSARVFIEDRYFLAQVQKSQIFTIFNF
jgi:hypothetical protein